MLVGVNHTQMLLKGNGKERLAGDDWLFEGPATYIPRVEEVVVNNVNAVVIKPSVVSLAGARRWAAIARQHGADAVISGAFESGIARRIHLALAAAVGTDTPISGLSTADWLGADLLDPPLRPDGDRFVLPGPERSIRLGQLQEVAAG